MPTDNLRPLLVAALTREHYRRSRERISASPEEHSAAMADVALAVRDAEMERLRAELDDQRAATKIAGDCADRFRDVLSEALGHPDENPGDDVLIAGLRQHFGKTGPEPTRWREFVAGARAVVDQINAGRRAASTPEHQVHAPENPAGEAL